MFWLQWVDLNTETAASHFSVAEKTEDRDKILRLNTSQSAKHLYPPTVFYDVFLQQKILGWKIKIRDKQN